MASPLSDVYRTAASQAELARLTGLPVRTVRELIRLGAVEKARRDQTGKLIYCFEHYQQVRRAKVLLDVGLTVLDAASFCEPVLREGRVPSGLHLPHLLHAKGQNTVWQTDGVQITISADCKPETERLIRALSKAIEDTRNSEKDLRRRIRSGGF